MFLALDPGVKTGWAAFSDEHGLESGVWSFSKEKTRGARYSRFRARLHQEVKRHKVEIIGVEMPVIAPHTNALQVRLAYGWMAEVECYCADHNLPEPEEVVIQSWRSTFLPGFRPLDLRSAGATKPQRDNHRRKQWKEAAKVRCARMGLDVASDDEAEAIGLLEHLRTIKDADFAHSRGRIHKDHQGDLLDELMGAA